MSDADLQDPRFTDEKAAREALEVSVWPNGAVCPHCGNVDSNKIAKLETKSVRAGLYHCKECRLQFTATVGTIFERSKIPLTKWWFAMHLVGSSKKGMSARQLNQMLGISYKSAWFMLDRIRQAMRLAGFSPTGGEGSIVRPIKPTSARRTASKPSKPLGTRTPH
jgi:transposase-like protein